MDKMVVGDGVSAETLAYVRRLQRDMLKHLDDATLKNLVERNQRVIIIPRGTKFSDVPPFTKFKGEKTLDGRSFDDVTLGIANVSMGPGKSGRAMGICEGGLFGGDEGNPKGRVFYHEYGHAVMGALPLRGEPASQRRIREIYDASMKRPEKTGLNAYANTSADEFFAEATAAFFGFGKVYADVNDDQNKPQKKHTSTRVLSPSLVHGIIAVRDTFWGPFQETPASLQRANPAIYALCLWVYGSPALIRNRIEDRK